ncbi:MAG: hypothetical protein KME11_05205 [Timaviella obliquedivisa GSE-PSE-MK23-08B]|jgi:hypothetical protein|nr:hypothetical protein [Timaviella obliquedivisa GSE-PSE-MK23-08B]
MKNTMLLLNRFVFSVELSRELWWINVPKSFNRNYQLFSITWVEHCVDGDPLRVSGFEIFILWMHLIVGIAY